MIITRNADGTYLATLALDEANGLATIAKVRQQTEADVLRDAATAVVSQLTATVAALRGESLRELYRRIDALPTTDLPRLLDAIPVAVGKV